MTKKLMKYDIRKMFSFLPYLYVGTLLLAIVARLINIGKNVQIVGIIGQVFASLCYSAIASVLINTFIIILGTFIRNFYKDESYLTHTLPVTKEALVMSKYLSALVVIVCSVAVSILSLLIVLYGTELLELIKYSLISAVSGLNISGGALVALLALIIFFEICSMMSAAFTAIVVANRYNSRRVLHGVLWFVLYYFALMLVTLLVSIICLAIGGNLADLTADKMSGGGFITIIIVALAVNIVYSALFGFICTKMFKKGVNVD